MHRLKNCKTILLKECRAHLNAVFASCNTQTGVVPPFGLTGEITAKIVLKEFAVGVETTGAQNVTLWATFTLLVQKEKNLVVRINGEIQPNPEQQVIVHDEVLDCNVANSPDITDLQLRNCRKLEDPFEALRIIVGYIAVWEEASLEMSERKMAILYIAR